MKIKILATLIFAFVISCKEKPITSPNTIVNVELKSFLPFETVELHDLGFFEQGETNWKIGSQVFVDRTKKQTISLQEGKGVLVNVPDSVTKGHLFTTMNHGDIEMEVDVMMPVGSNSGIYFQSRYEVQLFDSWGKDSIAASDMGGIYHRWDEERGKGKEGFEGSAPKLNAAKSPGLWQHFKILFHAPKFDGGGNKIKNASFEEVWLNGVLVQNNVELSGPTRAAAFSDEKVRAPLMIQGDHGPVAFRNMKFKSYTGKKVSLSDISMTEYENKEVQLPNYDSLVPLRTIKTDSISANMVGGNRAQRILKYVGKMNIPDSGEYLFDFKVNVAGGLLLIDQDTIVNLNGDYNLDSLGLGKVTLKKGTVPFSLIYNKHLPWTIGFSLEVEGPGVQKHALQAPGSLDLTRGKPKERIMVKVHDEPVVQRSFLMHNGVKRTHCISVGNPEGIHYAYDLERGSLLKVWSDDFLDATPMWHARGEKQLGLPAGFTVSLHGAPEFSQLENEHSEWPEGVNENSNRKQRGYEFDENGIPTFSSQIGSSTISDKMTPSKTLRMLHRVIEVKGNLEIWHKVASGESIEKLPDGTFFVNDESYFIDFYDGGNLTPVIRKRDEMDELLVRVPGGDQSVEYSLIW